VTEPFGTDWISTVYDALCAAARDEPCDESALDRVFEAYRASEYGFRTAFEGYRRMRKYVLLRPSVISLIQEVLALAHRRKGLGPRLAGGCRDIIGMQRLEHLRIAARLSWLPIVQTS